jgi:hypothetical protein
MCWGGPRKGFCGCSFDFFLFVFFPFVVLGLELRAPLLLGKRPVHLYCLFLKTKKDVWIFEWS